MYRCVLWVVLDKERVRRERPREGVNEWFSSVINDFIWLVQITVEGAVLTLTLTEFHHPRKQDQNGLNEGIAILSKAS